MNPRSRSLTFFLFAIICLTFTGAIAFAQDARPIAAEPPSATWEPEELQAGEPYDFSVEATPQLDSLVKVVPLNTVFPEAPFMVSPPNGTAFFHYPRVTNLAWQPVTGADRYVVEKAYFSSSWISYPPVTVVGVNNTSHTFTFVGDQAGRWRVTAYRGTTASCVSPWWTFSYRTRPQMADPVLTNPAADAKFSHYPRALTLSWKMVPAAAGYLLERKYCQAGVVNCVAYPSVTITDPLRSYYSFSFVGAQPGMWRVTVLGGSSFFNSAPSEWRVFEFDK